MNFLFKIITCLIVGWFILPTAFAGGSVSGLKIKQIWSGSYRDGALSATRLYLNTAHRNPDGCSDAKIIAIVSGTSTKGIVSNLHIKQLEFDQMFTTAMMAQSTQQQIGAFIAGCTSDGRYARALRLSINN